GAGAELLGYLQKMRFFSRVEPRDATGEWAVLSLVGPRAAEAVATLGVTELAPPETLPVPGPKFPTGSVPPRATSRYDVRPLIGGDGGWVRRVPLGVDLLVPRDEMPRVVSRLLDAGVPA